MKVISGIKPHPRRIMLYGPHGVGKGTWAACAPRPIFLDIEDGLGSIDCERTEVLGTYSQVSDALTWLLTGDHNYQTAVIDTVDWLEQLIHRQVATDAGVKSIADIGYGKGYSRALPMWNWVISQLDQIRRQRKMAVILLSHAKVERYESPDSESYDRYSPDLHKSSCSMVQEWCDEVLFANFRVFTKEQGEGSRKRTVAIGGKDRYIRTSESASSVAKNRLNLPDELPLEWSAYASAVAAYYAANKREPEPVEVGNMAGIVTNGSSKPVDAGYAETLKQAEEVF